MIYTVTGFSLDDEKTGCFKTNRCFGYMLNFEDAEDSVKVNACDINEAGYYPYVVIEKVGEGFYAIPEKEWFYKFNEDTEFYEPTSKPKQLEYICCFGIG